MTMDVLARAADLNRATLSLIETGETKNPGIITLLAIAEALGVSVMAFLDEGAFRQGLFDILRERYGELAEFFVVPNDRELISV